MYTFEQLKYKLNNDLDYSVFLSQYLYVSGKFDSIYNNRKDTEDSFPDYLHRCINRNTATMMYTYFDYLLLYNILKNIMITNKQKGEKQ